MLSPREIAGCSIAGVLIAATCLGSSTARQRQKWAVAAIDRATRLACGCWAGSSQCGSDPESTGMGNSAGNPGPYLQLRPMLTITEIIEMSINGIGDSIIIEKIRVRGGNFDVSPQTIIYLRRFGVSDAVIQAMRNVGGSC